MRIKKNSIFHPLVNSCWSKNLNSRCWFSVTPPRTCVWTLQTQSTLFWINSILCLNISYLIYFSYLIYCKYIHIYNKCTFIYVYKYNMYVIYNMNIKLTVWETILLELFICLLLFLWLDWFYNFVFVIISHYSYVLECYKYNKKWTIPFWKYLYQQNLKIPKFLNYSIRHFLHFPIKDIFFLKYAYIIFFLYYWIHFR